MLKLSSPETCSFFPLPELFGASQEVSQVSVLLIIFHHTPPCLVSHVLVGAVTDKRWYTRITPIILSPASTGESGTKPSFDSGVNGGFYLAMRQDSYDLTDHDGKAGDKNLPKLLMREAGTCTTSFPLTHYTVRLFQQLLNLLTKCHLGT